MPLRRESLQSLTLFGGELLANSGQVGAAIPSSRALARRIASHVSPGSPGYVLELGAGTGSVTAALLDRGVAPDRLLPVELSAKMADHLQKRFPDVRVLQGDASAMRSLLGQAVPAAIGRIDAIVSSLPLRSLPAPVVAAIVREIHELLGREGRFIQFTYSLVSRDFQPLRAFERVESSVIWGNLPPARVDVFRAR